MSSSSSEIKLAPDDMPSDGITRVLFPPTASNSNMLLMSSWDSSCSLYDVSRNRLVHRYNHDVDTGVLDVCWGDGNTCFSSGVDGHIRRCDLQRYSESAVVSSCSAAISAVCFSPAYGLVLGGSWSGEVTAIDPRVGATSQQSAQTAGKVFCMDMGSDHKLVVARADQVVDVYDIRKIERPMQERQSPLAHQTRSVTVFPNNAAFALGSIQGRCAVEYFQEHGAAAKTTKKKKAFAFKCHRVREADTDEVYAVNALCVNPKDGTLVTGGSDGHVVLWDPVAKRRLTQYHQYDQGISSLSYNFDGSLLATAVSYTFEQGERQEEWPQDAVFIRTV